MSHRRKSKPKTKRQAARRRAVAREAEEFFDEMMDFCTVIGMGAALEAGDILDGSQDRELSDADRRLLSVVLAAGDCWCDPEEIRLEDSVDETIWRLRWIWEASQEEPVS